MSESIHERCGEQRLQVSAGHIAEGPSFRISFFLSSRFFRSVIFMHPVYNSAQEKVLCIFRKRNIGLYPLAKISCRPMVPNQRAWFLHFVASFLPHPPPQTLSNVWRPFLGEQGGCWPLVGGGQGCRYPVASHSKDYTAPNVSCTKTQKTCSNMMNSAKSCAVII